MTLCPDDDETLLRGYDWPLLEERAVQELHGLAAALVYDGQLDDLELRQLSEWLSAKEAFCQRWPLHAPLPVH